ncbi:putative L-type amino acid transporter 1-like protein MLAS [Orbicella faveolata]|uniref:putative L-type amino acid transporter 1-like protein MLAS n=1 Tax=Orbicella faveolata TaxID=48498 RepID=UPI0009E34D88|nr:putative L-type amino acid transporter 1-like protein MLAS [Orbicella faveolata]
MSEDSPSQRFLTQNKDVEHGGEKRDGTSPILKRSLGVPGGIAFLVGTIVGSGIFATPKWVLFYVGSEGMSLVMWTICGIFALFGALCYSELGTLIPKSGAVTEESLAIYEAAAPTNMKKTSQIAEQYFQTYFAEAT